MTVRFMYIALAHIALPIAALVTASAPAAAQQQSESYKFLQAVREEKSADVTRMVEEPGSTIINTRDRGTGEGALHIVVKSGNSVYLSYLLGKKADPNLRDDKGNTPLLLAASAGRNDLVDILVAHKANLNLGNSSGETPLIRAVQRRDLAMARSLITAGADPDQADLLAGMSARDYAHDDPRAVAMAKLMDETPKKVRRAVAGPKL